MSTYNSRTGQWEEGSASGGMFPFLSQEKNKYNYRNEFPRAQKPTGNEQIAIQGSEEGLSGTGAHFGGGNLMDALRKILQSGKYDNILGRGEPPKAAGFGFDLPTLEMGGTVMGGIGKFMTGMGALETANYAGKSYEEKKKQNTLNWGAAKEARAGDVLQANANIGDQNAYRTSQGMTNLADYITA